MDIENFPVLPEIHYTEQNITIPAEQDALDEVIRQHMQHPGSVISWQPYRILWGRWQNQTIQWANMETVQIRDIQEIRVFNETEELHLYRAGRPLMGRYICDDSGNTVTHYVDTTAPLLGNESTTLGDGFIQLRDKERKLQMAIPANNPDENEKHPYYGLKTRNYVTIYDNGQAGYGDYRFVAIIPAKGGILHG